RKASPGGPKESYPWGMAFFVFIIHLDLKQVSADRLGRESVQDVRASERGGLQGAVRRTATGRQVQVGPKRVILGGWLFLCS
ncbi:MAG: hypothetical protein AB1798_14395, partial [Spirochaetota bacterium]